MALAVALALAGCVDPASEGPGVGGVSILGGWELNSGTTCLETLAFRPGGRFAHGIAALAEGWHLQLQHGGAFTGTPETGPDGSLLLQALADAAAPVPGLAHCAQWGAAGAATLPLGPLVDEVESATLAWRPVPLAGGAWAWVGTDGAAAVRLVLVRAEGRLRGFLPDAGLGPGVTLLHRVPVALPSTYPGLFGSTPLVHLPQQSFATILPMAAQSQLLLVLHSASDVTFTPVPGLPPVCNLIAWSDPLFNNEVPGPNPLGDIATSPMVTLNPGDPDGPVVAQDVTGAVGLDNPLYLLPVQAVAPADGPCSVNIRARPLVARLAAGHAADPLAPDAFAVALQAGPAYLLGEPRGQPGALTLAPLAGGQPWPLGRLVPRVVVPPLDPADPLGLAGGGATDLRLSVQGGAASRYLNIFPAQGAGTGLGPLAAHVPAGAATPAALPGSVPLALADASPVALRVELAAPGLVELYTDGGAETRATLRDAEGSLLATARGGAADGVGFRLVAYVPAGSYDLEVQALAAPAAPTLHLEQPTPVPGLPAGPLAACLLGATPPDLTPADLRWADCRERGIASLAGIGAGGEYANLQGLRLDDNPITDLSPLAPLIWLGELSLAGTAPESLAPLASLPRLYALRLARVPLDAAGRDVLAGLGARLTELDLSGATGLAPADIDLLRAALPNARLIAPDGTVTE